MVVLQVKAREEEELLTLHPITGPKEVVEGEEVEFRMRLTRAARGKSAGAELRVDVEANYGLEPGPAQLPPQVLYVSKQGSQVIYRFLPASHEATPEEHRQGLMKREFTIVVRYREGNRTMRKLQKYPFAVRLNLERVVRRVPASLGNILGLTPKSLQ